MGNSIADIKYSSFDENRHGLFSVVMVGTMALSFPTFAEIDYGEDCSLPKYVVAIASSASTAISSWKIKAKRDNSSSALTRKEFVKRLLELRKEAMSKGMKLLDADEIIMEVKRRRGESV